MNKIAVIFLLFLCLLTNCKDKYDPSIKSTNQTLLVVDGNLNPTDTTFIRLSKTVSVDTETINDDISLWAGESQWPSISQIHLEDLDNNSAVTSDMFASKSGITYSDVIAANNRVKEEIDAIRILVDKAPSDYRQFTVMGLIQRENLFRRFPRKLKDKMRKLYNMDSIEIPEHIYKSSSVELDLSFGC